MCVCVEWSLVMHNIYVDAHTYAYVMWKCVEKIAVECIVYISLWTPIVYVYDFACKASTILAM